MYAGPLASLFARPLIVLAPMEDVSDLPFRRLCREFGAELTLTEFIRAEGLIARDRIATRKLELAPDERPVGVQIYGSNAELLMQAAEVAREAQPTLIDINCGCWVPRVARGGAGAAWLRRPEAMVEMAARVVSAVAPLPVTVKTRLGWDERAIGIVELAQRLEGVGVAAITLHCRTAVMGHSGPADWSWAARVAAAVRVPVIVNGDIRSGDDAARALAETGCAGVMIGRAAIDAPWIFREIVARLRRGEQLADAPFAERADLYLRLLSENVARRGAKFGVEVTRRHGRWFDAELRHALVRAPSYAECSAVLATRRAA